MADYENRFAEIKATLRLHTWLLAANVAMTTAIFWKVFTG
jgi:hypothetical protein